MKREARQNYYRQMHTAAREIYEAGQTDEQERIIKLLETDIATNNKDYSGEMEWGLYKAIELIKGETK